MKSLLSKDEKTKLLETFRSSDQTQAVFAEVNGINPKTLARWIYQQRLEARQNQNNVEFVGLEADNSKNQTMSKLMKQKIKLKDNRKNFAMYSFMTLLQS